MPLRGRWPPHGLVQGGAGQVRQSEVLAALSHALDMTEGHPVGQAERTCLIGMRIARELQLDDRVELRALLRPAAEGRRLLVVAPRACASCSARTTSRSRRTASSSTGRSPCRSPATPRSTSRRAAAIARAQHTLSVLRTLVAEGKAIVETRCDRGADDRPEPRLPRGERRRRPRARRVLGRQGPARTAWRASEIPLLGPDRLPRPGRRGLLRHARRRGGARDGARAPRALVRPRARRRRAGYRPRGSRSGATS